MYSKHEASLIRKNFWTSFGQYMKPLKNSEGEAINWVNYKTGIRHIYFRMDADNKHASIAIELVHPDQLQRDHQFDQFVQLKSIFTESVGEQWQWKRGIQDDTGKIVDRIGMELRNVNVFDSNDWPAIISFLKPRIIALDEFWNMVKDDFS